MSYFICQTPYWVEGRFSTCVTNHYLNVLIPCASTALSLLIVVISCVFNLSQRRFPLDKYQSVDANDSNGKSKARDIGVFVRKQGPKTTILEAAALLLNVVVETSLFFHSSRSQSHGFAELASLLISLYVLGIAQRRWFRVRAAKNFAYLWPHSGLLYAIQWFCSLFVFESALLRGFHGYLSIAALLKLVLFTVLVVIHITTPQIFVPALQTEEDEGSYPPLSEEETSSIISKYTFFWVGGFAWKARRQPLQPEDLPELRRDIRAHYIDRVSPKAQNTTTPLWYRLFQFVKYGLLVQGAWAVILSVSMFTPAFMLKLILEYLEDPRIFTKSTAWLCVMGLLLAGIITSLSENQCEYIGWTLTTKLHAMLNNEIYAKALKREVAGAPSTEASADDSGKAESERNSVTEGNILNLMAMDVSKIDHVVTYFHLGWICFPLQMTIGIGLLYSILGISSIAGLVVMFVSLTLTTRLATGFSNAQRRLMTATDARVQASNELITNIRFIKYCAWESPFKERLMELRQTELKRLRTKFIWWSSAMTTFFMVPFVVTIFTLSFYTLIEKKQLTTKVAFPTLAAFQVIRLPLDRFSSIISFILESRVSLDRINAFLNEKESSHDAQLSKSDIDLVGFEHATFEWPNRARLQYAAQDIGSGPGISTSAAPFRLGNLHISFRKHGLNIICGPSGSGKSSLLLALLGEMKLIQGRVSLPSAGMSRSSLWIQQDRFDTQAAAYCPQQAWIMNQSIRANILIGSPFDSHRYEEVIKAVALAQDFVELKDSDLTLAGENGGRLSGGQKQRVALARALYSNTPYVILDDCLSAVDSRTAKHIFFNAIKGPLMSGRTCILAIHNIKLALPHCDYAIILDKGQVREQGTGKELMSSAIVRESIKESEIKIQSTEVHEQDSSEMVDSLGSSPSRNSSEQAIDLNSDMNKDISKAGPQYTEAKSTGAIPWHVLKSYYRVMGSYWFLSAIPLIYVAQEIVALGTNLWIKEWTRQVDRSIEQSPASASQKSSRAHDEVNAAKYLLIYCAICILYALITLIRDLFSYYGALKASSQIFSLLLNRVVHAKLLFFDRVPLGQITNRFSKDMETVDQEAPRWSVALLNLFTGVLMTLLLISWSLPAFIPIMPIVTVAYFVIMSVFVSTSRDLKRIESIKRSPLYQQLGETLAGHVSIRAYSRVLSFVTYNHELIDQYNQPGLMGNAVKSWFSFRIACTSSMVSFLTGVFVLWNAKTISPGVAGIALTYASTFTDYVIWLVQVYARFQQSFNSVERVQEYIQIDQEPTEPLIPKHDIPPEWPSRGHVRFECYSTRYASTLELVLKEIDFEARSGERVAIVGRTGAGKSTLTLALIRGLEAETGRIKIDDVDIASVTLERLRTAIAVVPQDPTLFNGSVRDNLDLLKIYTDEEIRSVLAQIRLFDLLGKSIDLDFPAAALSQGQRQMVCIARALLRRSPVLVFDEATASIDHDSDAVIQAGLRAGISAGTTVITIAHRLQTIADYDKVIVLEAGSIVEQGSPNELLSRSGDKAIFRTLCEQSGDLKGIEKAAGHTPL